MSFSRQDDFPETTLAEDDELGPPWTRVQRRSSQRGRGNYRDPPQRQGGRGNGLGQRGGTHGRRDIPESALNDDSDDNGWVSMRELQRRERESGWGRHRDYPAGLFQDTNTEEDEVGTSGTSDWTQPRNTGTGNHRSSPQRQGGMGRDPGQRDGSIGYRSPHLQQKWEREKVDIDRGAMVSIGRANSGGRNWNRQGQTQQRSNGYNREGGNIWNNRAYGSGNTTTPRRQETPFVAGERVLETRPRVDNPEGQKQETKFVMDKKDYVFDPTKVPKEANPAQLRPSQNMYTLAQTLFKKDVKDWEMQDINTPGSSDGTSILISAFVDYAASTLKTEMSMSQQLTLSRVAIATAPQRLLEYFKDPFKAMHFTEWALQRNGNLPPVLEPLLCPIDTPNLITDEEVLAKIVDGDLPLEEQAIVIEAFVKCYYPKHVNMIMDVVAGLTQTSRRVYIECPGKIEREMKGMNKPLHFSPPKWYRLSLHPEVIIQTTPRQSATEGTERMKLEISAADVAGKLKLQIDDLIKLPLDRLRTEILKAIPMIFEDRISRSGCSDTFKYFESLPSNEIYRFLGREPPTEEAEAAKEVKVTQIFRYLVRLEHKAKKEGGTWTESAEEILRAWINAIHPILRTRRESLILSMHFLAQEAVDRLILTTPFLLEGEEIRRHMTATTQSAELSQLDVWIKSSCDHLQDITNESDALTDEYETAMSNRDTIVKYRSRMPDSLLPMVMIGGSIETAADETIEEEFFDRLLMAGINREEVPEYHIENTELSTLDGSSFDRIKCIVAARQDAQRLQDMIVRVATPADRSRYLATRDYKYTVIGYPPTEASDKAVRDVLRDHKLFKASLVRTSIYGFTGIDPFMDVPKNMKDLCTREVSKNDDKKTVAYFLLTMKMRGKDGGSKSTPVIRVSTNKANTKIYLYAPKTEAEDLVRFTKEVMNLMSLWYPNMNLKLKGDLVEAMQLAQSVKQLTPMEVQAQNSRILQKYGETSEEQRKFDTSRTTEEITEIAKEGIRNKFTGGFESSRIQEVQDVSHGSNGEMTGAEMIRKDLLAIKDEQRAQMTKIAELTTMVHTMLERTVESSVVTTTLQTMSTLIGTSAQSSISSITEVATAIREQMEEQSKQIQANVLKNSENIVTSCNRISEIDARIVELRSLVLRQELAAGTASEAADRTNKQQLQIIEMLEAQQKYIQNMKTMQINEQPDFGRDTEEVDNDAEVDTSYQMQSEEYTAEIRQKAHHVLSLVQTMPYRKLLDGGKLTAAENTQESTATSEKAASETAAGLQSCKTCGKRDYSLLYCDNCNTPSLHHAACMTFVEGLAEYHCNECYYQGLGPSNNPGGMDETGNTEQGGREDQKIESAPHSNEEEQKDRDNSDHSEMSMSSSSSSSASLVKPYTPRYKRNDTRTKTLPSLANSELGKKKQKIIDIDEISPMMTRAQRLAKEKIKKTREDAFDTSDEEGDGSNK